MIGLPRCSLAGADLALEHTVWEETNLGLLFDLHANDIRGWNLWAIELFSIMKRLSLVVPVKITYTKRFYILIIPRLQ
jgi:hypothetical protein